MKVTYTCSYHQHDTRLSRSTPYLGDMKSNLDIPLRQDVPVELQVLEHYLGDSERAKAVHDSFITSNFWGRVTYEGNGWSITGAELDEAIAETEGKKAQRVEK